MGIIAVLLIQKIPIVISPFYMRVIFYISVSLLIIRLAFTKPWKNSNVSIGEEGLIDRTGLVIEECSPIGRVKIGNELWQAKSINGDNIAQGDTIIVHRVEGFLLFIEKYKNSNNSSPA